MVLTRAAAQVYFHLVRVLLHLVLLLGLLAGTGAHSSALAAEPCPMEEAHSAGQAQSNDCCPEHAPDGHDSESCKAMMAACVATASCGLLGTSGPGSSSMSGVDASGGLLFAAMTSALRGRTIPPDTHPPAYLN